MKTRRKGGIFLTKKTRYRGLTGVAPGEAIGYVEKKRRVL